MAEMMKSDEAPTTPPKDDRVPSPPPPLVEHLDVPPPPQQQTSFEEQVQSEARSGTGIGPAENREPAEEAGDDEMIRLRRAAAAGRETLPLLHPTPDLHAGPPSYTPPATSTSSNPPTSTATSIDTNSTSTTPSSSTMPFSTSSIKATSSRKREAGHPPPLIERIPSSTSDDFGDFVDAPPSALPVLTGDMDPLTPDFVGEHQNPSQATNTEASTLRLQDPLSAQTQIHVALDPLSLFSEQPQPQPRLFTSPSSEPLLPPTPSLSSPAPPPPPKPSRPPTNLVDEVLRYENGGLSLFSDPAFNLNDTPASPAPPAPPPRSPSPSPSPNLPPPPHREWNSRTATPTPLAYAGGMLSPTPLYAPTTTATPPNTAAQPGGVFKDHPLAPSPGKERTPPKITTPHLPPASLASVPSSSSSSALSSTSNLANLAAEEKLKRATSPHAETEIIAHHLGLIDDDYFSSREPADASALSIPVPPSLSRSRSRSSGGSVTPGAVVGGLVGSLGSLLGGGGSGSSGTTGTRGREGGGGDEGGVGGVGRGREGSPVHRRAAPPVMSPGGEWGLGEEGSEHHHHHHRHHHHHHTPSPPTRTPSSSSGTLGGLWGLWKGATPEEQHYHHHHHTHMHGQAMTTASPQPVQPVIVEGQPVVFEERSSSESSLERDEHHRTSGSVGVQGRNGRPLPKARMSLESIQQRWAEHDHGGRSPSHGLGVPNPNKSRTPSPSRTRRVSDNVRIDPPTITHVSPFAPPPPPPTSTLFASSGMHAGFGDPVGGGLVSSSVGASSSSSLLGGGLGRGSGGGGANPFGSHTFVPIPGAPGFRPEGYDWDKGFSEELERELGGSPLPSSSPSPVAVKEKAGSYEVGERGGEGRGGVRERGRQPRQDRGKEKEMSIYQTIGSRFGLWGSPSSSSSTPSTSSAASSSSEFSAPWEKGATGTTGRGAYNGHGRSATTPNSSYNAYSTTSVQGGVGSEKGGQGSEKGMGSGSGKRVGELIEKKVGGVELKGRKESTVGVLGRGVGDKLRPHLPPLSRLPRTWTLLYSMDQHGISLNTLYTLCEAPEKTRRPAQPYVGNGGHILVIRDDAPDSSSSSSMDNNSCFGVYVADGLSRSKAKGFYGGGDSFLFKYHGGSGRMEVWHPTGRNAYYALCEPGYMAFGGGGGGGSGYALWVGDDLLEGSSCAGGVGGGTFGNEVLCFGGRRKVGKNNGEGEVEFEVVGLEVWGVGPS